MNDSSYSAVYVLVRNYVALDPVTMTGTAGIGFSSSGSIRRGKQPKPRGVKSTENADSTKNVGRVPVLSRFQTSI